MSERERVIAVGGDPGDGFTVGGQPSMSGEYGRGLEDCERMI